MYHPGDLQATDIDEGTGGEAKDCGSTLRSSRCGVGLLDENLLFWRLENFPRRYLIGKYFQQAEVTLAESGREKARHRSLVYGGGSLVALALDVQLRKATGNRKGMDDLMRAMYERYGKTGKTYTTADVASLAGEIGGTDFGPFFARYVTGKEYLSIEPYLGDLGLEMQTFLEETRISWKEGATEAERAAFKAIFGR